MEKDRPKREKIQQINEAKQAVIKQKEEARIKKEQEKAKSYMEKVKMSLQDKASQSLEKVKQSKIENQTKERKNEEKQSKNLEKVQEKQLKAEKQLQIKTVKEQDKIDKQQQKKATQIIKLAEKDSKRDEKYNRKLFPITASVPESFADPPPTGRKKDKKKRVKTAPIECEQIPEDNVNKRQNWSKVSKELYNSTYFKVVQKFQEPENQCIFEVEGMFDFQQGNICQYNRINTHEEARNLALKELISAQQCLNWNPKSKMSWLKRAGGDHQNVKKSKTYMYFVGREIQKLDNGLSLFFVKNLSLNRGETMPEKTVYSAEEAFTLAPHYIQTQTDVLEWNPAENLIKAKSMHKVKEVVYGPGCCIFIGKNLGDAQVKKPEESDFKLVLLLFNKVSSLLQFRIPTFLSGKETVRLMSIAKNV